MNNCCNQPWCPYNPPFNPTPINPSPLPYPYKPDDYINGFKQGHKMGKYEEQERIIRILIGEGVDSMIIKKIQGSLLNKQNSIKNKNINIKDVLRKIPK